MNDYAVKKTDNKWKRVLMILIISLVVALLAGSAAVYKTYRSNLKPLSQNGNSQLVTIPTGASTAEIAIQLKESGIIRSSWAFEWYVRTNRLRSQLQAGTFALRPSQSVAEIALVLTGGREASDLVTIYPAKRIDEVRDDLINQGFDAQAVDAAIIASDYADHPALAEKPENASLEGYLFPESFHRTASTTPKDIIRASLDQMSTQLTPEIRAGFAAQGLTLHQAITLASIVEQEVGSKDPEVDLADKKKVAQVFLRRLRENMPLESDATSSYGAILAGAEPSISFTSSYNTYQNKGLTPSPISNVSKNSLLAVSVPADTDYLYFVSGDNGTNYFSRTLDEHRNFTRQYCSRCP